MRWPNDGGCMKKLIENTMVTWIWLCAIAILSLTVLLLFGFAAMMLGSGASQSVGYLDIAYVLPLTLYRMGYTVTTALAGVLLATPLALAMSLVAVYLLPRKIGLLFGKLGFGFSAVPAVVLGYMALCYVAPGAPGPWSGLSLSLALMAIPRLFSEFFLLLNGDTSLRMASACLGARPYQTVLYFCLPAHRQEILHISLGALARAMCEGVAVRMVLFYFGNDYDTLVTGTMRALGVTSVSVSMGMAIVQSVALLLPLSILYITIYVLRER